MNRPTKARFAFYRFEITVLFCALWGIATGLWWQSALPVVGLMAEAYVRVLSLVLIPFVFCAVILGVAQLGTLRRFSWAVFKFLMLVAATAGVSAVVAWCAALILMPGHGATVPLQAVPANLEIPLDKALLIDVFRRFFPEHIIKAFGEGYLGASVVIALVFGLSLMTLGTKVQAAHRFFESLHAIFLVWVKGVMWISPLGLGCLLAQAIGENNVQLTAPFLVYAGTLALAYFVHTFVVLGFVSAALAKLKPLRFFSRVLPATLIATLTRNPFLGLPAALTRVIKKTSGPQRLSAVPLSLGSIFCLQGTLIYTIVSVFFIIQLYGVEVSLFKQILILGASYLSVLVCLGLPGTGLVAVAMVLHLVGLPVQGVGFLIGSSVFFDMVRVSVDLYTNACIGACVTKLEG
ncbi:MAG: dicarboxylate/amino acid:cation symporter [Candidatus Margulisiibacteriota bacterium]